MSVSIDNAINIITKLDVKLKTEIIAIEDILHRFSAEKIFAKSSLPKYESSAMDGYAIFSQDYEKELLLTDTVLAGDNFKKPLERGTCIKIMTGAKVPENANAVIPKEDVEILENKKIKIKKFFRTFQNIKHEAEDIKKGQLLVDKGEEFNFAQITLLASQGITHIKVYKKPNFVAFASGEELKLPSDLTADYQIYNSNTNTFLAIAKEAHCNIRFIGQARDSIQSIQNLISNCKNADFMVTSGGISVGDADFTKESFESFDFEKIIEKIDVTPGRPTILGKLENTFVLNLPGNPLAGTLVLNIFGRILIQKLAGSKKIYPNYILGKMKNSLKLNKGRHTIIPGLFDGEYFTHSDKRFPGMVSVLSNCNSLIILDKSVNKLKKDSIIKILPINWNFYSEIKKDILTYE